MELIVGNAVNKKPSAADIFRAIDSAVMAPDFSITLDAGNRGSLDAYGETQGGFSVVAAGAGRTYRSARPVDAPVLKNLFVKYLKGDASWRNDCPWATEDALAADDQGPTDQVAEVEPRVEEKPLAAAPQTLPPQTTPEPGPLPLAQEHKPSRALSIALAAAALIAAAVGLYLLR